MTTEDSQEIRKRGHCYCGCAETSWQLELNSATKIVRCSRCGLVRTFPFPFDSELGGVEISSVPVYDRDEHLYRKFAQGLLQVLKDYVPLSAQVVDVGCGPGIFADEIRRAGYSVLGMDLDRACIDYGQAKGYPIEYGTLNENHPEKLDAIVASHTLEHIFRLGPALACFHACLKPGGYLFLSQPNYRSWMGRLRGVCWAGWVASQHHWHFDSSTLVQILRAHNFQVLEVRQDKLHEPWPSLRWLRNPRTFLRRWSRALIARVAPWFGQGDCLNYVALKLD